MGTNYRAHEIKSENILIWLVGRNDRLDRFLNAIDYCYPDGIFDCEVIPEAMDNLDLYGYLECVEEGYESDVEYINARIHSFNRLINGDLWVDAAIRSNIDKLIEKGLNPEKVEREKNRPSIWDSIFNSKC